MNKLPDGWEEKYIEEVFEIRKNYTNARKDLDNNSNISYLHYGDIHKYYQHKLDCKNISLPKISENKLSKDINKLELVKNGDLIVVDVSEDYKGICSSVEVKNLSYKLVSGLHTLLLRDKGNYFADGYKGYIFYNHNVHKECCKVVTGISVYGINRKNFKKIKIPIPPLDEQKRIASALSKIDAYLENTIKLIEEKERFKRGIAKKLLTCKEGENIPEARFKGFEDEWEIVKLGDMFDNFKEKNNEDKIILASTIDKGVIPNSLTERKIIRKKESLSNYKLVKKGCFVISLMSFQSGFEYSDYEGIISPAYTVLKPKIEMAHYFYKYYFKSFKFIKDLRPYAEGIRHGKQIKFKACKDILVPYPSIEEQEKIGGYLSLLDKEIDNLKKQKELIKEMKRGAMQKLLSGEVRLSKNAFNENI
ncbi:restriction endonuclease subunit S [Brachyspira aalborgi]|uniref:restriction endonuclease subunit S n=1 Tax=Brachyspira aalborgi TaxID=29522 RepID=UPI0011CB5108|nr:restriction endonuclease subunit S [Brachyspira aalborgi]TXJ16200.1 restriction endonuclease subunit S [Brachyspira aalborgi]TXJ21831.1 restriction endonuclease subunit S [Brachyspira aalborgi]TXJ49444.1 restriction endonuclease subunit S [Brachyspira aalborgi]